MQVWAVVYDEEEFTDELYQRSLLLVDTETQQRIARFYRRPDACRCLIGRVLPRMLLNEQGVSTASFSFAKTVHGKPYIATHLDTPLAFNVSHDNELVAMVSGPGHHHGPHFSLGVDVMKVELPRRESFLSFVTMMKEQMTNRERHSVLSVSEDEGLRRFFWLWTLKEAYTKALGIGLGFDFSRVEYDIEANLVRVDGAIPRGWRFTKFIIDRRESRYQGVVAEYFGEQAATYVIPETTPTPWLHVHEAAAFIQRSIETLI